MRGNDKHPTRRSVNNGRQIKRGAYNSGITAYDKGHGRNNPYRAQNMIYGQPPKRHWGLAIVIAIALVAIIVLCAIACSGSGASQDQQAQGSAATATESSADATASEPASDSSAQATQSTDISSLSAEGVTITTTSAGAKSVSRSEDNRKATSTSRNTVKPTDKVVYLTFDDGPSENTHEILDILNQYGVHATWFVIEARGHLDYLPDIWSSGNQVALHSWTHEYNIDYKNKKSYLKGLDQLASKVNEQLGFTPTLLRFPGGSVNGYNRSCRSAIKSQIKERNLHYFDWNVDSGDANGDNVSVKTLLRNIKKESAGNNSCCVLMHDTESKDTTVKALPKIIEYYISEGYTFDVLTADSYGYHF
jgi:peptidoglycan/xylan/chitin deacetylase (PgdA/CDA1 family)